MIRRPPTSPLLPYPTLFRAAAVTVLVELHADVGSALHQAHGCGDERIGVGVQGRREARQPLVEVDRIARIRSEEHTSELQSRQYLVCRLLLEKKTQQTPNHD